MKCTCLKVIQMCAANNLSVARMMKGTNPMNPKNPVTKPPNYDSKTDTWGIENPWVPVSYLQMCFFT